MSMFLPAILDQGVLNVLAALAALSCAWGTAALLVRAGQVAPAAGRHVAIDGLRGLLALLVFVHHGLIWFRYTHSGRWQGTGSSLFTYFGEGSVQLFFMVTAFLFFSKLLDRRREMDWLGLYASRFMRLVPLYAFAMGLLFLSVAWASGGALRVPLAQLVLGMGKWLAFTMVGAPDLNGVAHTGVMVAGVTWSLPLEWFFYAILPGLALLVGRRVPLAWLALLLPAGIWFAFRDNAVLLVSAFGGGIVAAFAVRVEALRRLASGPLASVVVVLCLALTVSCFPVPYLPLPMALLSFAFVVLACGNQMFGLLTTAPMRLLGAMSYGLYLLHGLLLHAVFEMVLGRGLASSFSLAQHWAVVCVCAVLLVLLSHSCFRLIEWPAMQRAPQLRDALRAWASQHRLGQGRA
jgi:peptidoglycan/LPS O-acetylase OafA/YrhL